MKCYLAARSGYPFAVQRLICHVGLTMATSYVRGPAASPIWQLLLKIDFDRLFQCQLIT